MYPRRRLIALGLVAFVLSLAALVPARLALAVIPLPDALHIADPAGSLWDGRARLVTARGPYNVSWDLHPWQLLLLGVATDWQVSSEGMSVDGSVMWRPWVRTLVIRRGELSGGMLARALGGNGITIDQPLLLRDIEVSRAGAGEVRAARGAMAWGPGQVRLAGRPELVAVPALRGRLDVADGNLRVVVDGEPAPGQTLATAAANLRTRELHVVVLQRAADMIGLVEKGRRPPETALFDLRQPLP